MPSKSSPVNDNEPMTVCEPAVAYGRGVADNVSVTGDWNPNVPFHGTQEEWWEHFHRIEEGNFDTWEEHQKKFYTWKKNFLANRM